MCTPALKKRSQLLSVPAIEKWMEEHSKTLPTSCTLLELVLSVNNYTTSDVETVAVVTYLINSGRVRLCGTFAGAKISFPPTRTRCNRRRAPNPKRLNNHE